MNLKNYLSTLKRGDSTRLASNLGISISYLSQLASGKSPISATRCISIEQATNSAVTRRDLRPKDWYLIWPELENQQPKSQQTITCLSEPSQETT